MNRIALKMLVGDRAKYLGLIFGIMFAALLMSQQVSIFVGLLERTASQINDVSEADIWVMNPQVQYIDEIRALPDRDLLRVRSVPGVKWAVPFFKGMAMVRAPGGLLQQVIVLGVDDVSLIGQPLRMIQGSWLDLKHPDTLIMDKAGFQFMWPNEAPRIGHVVEINDHRVVIGGICEASAPFMTAPIVFARFSLATKISPGERNRMSFIVVKAQDGVTPAELVHRIEQETGLQAHTRKDFAWRSIMHYLTRTGIPINFGITVLLGFIIGAAVAGQTFYIFVIENLRQFGALKAMGMTNGQIFRMVLLQASVVAFIGYGIGIGLCALFFKVAGQGAALRGFVLHPEVALGVLVAVLIIIVLASIVSIHKVLVVDPAIVFRG